MLARPRSQPPCPDGKAELTLARGKGQPRDRGGQRQGKSWECEVQGKALSTQRSARTWLVLSNGGRGRKRHFQTNPVSVSCCCVTGGPSTVPGNSSVSAFLWLGTQSGWCGTRLHGEGPAAVCEGGHSRLMTSPGRAASLFLTLRPLSSESGVGGEGCSGPWDPGALVRISAFGLCPGSHLSLVGVCCFY